VQALSLESADNVKAMVEMMNKYRRKMVFWKHPAVNRLLALQQKAGDVGEGK
jgi:hypothetical protein